MTGPFTEYTSPKEDELIRMYEKHFSELYHLKLQNNSFNLRLLDETLIIPINVIDKKPTCPPSLRMILLLHEKSGFTHIAFILVFCVL